MNKWGASIINVFHGDTKVFEWSDAEAESPEDLIWDRRIREVFEAGVNAGNLEGAE
jgi:hypothetical protein